MDEMNNKQIVLLTMLTSFVVSIATGIITVAMLEEAPPTLTQTVNRVVERTIERVVTGSTTPEKKALPPVTTTVTKEVTIYAKEDDLIVAAVEKNQQRIAEIYSNLPEATIPLASGFIISRDGVIATDLRKISTELGLRESYKVLLGGVTYTAKPMKSDALGGSSIALLKISNTKEDDVFDAVAFGRQVDPKPAQSVIMIGGNSAGVLRATLSKFHYFESTGTSTPRAISAVDTAAKIPGEFGGSLVVNLDGQAVGIVVTTSDWTTLTIYPSTRILDLVTAVSAEATKASSEAPEGKVSVGAP